MLAQIENPIEIYKGEKSVIFQGLFKGIRVIYKELISNDCIWIAKFKNEIETYRNLPRGNFSGRLLESGENYFVREYIEGSTLSNDRYFQQSLNSNQIESILSVAKDISETWPNIDLKKYNYRKKILKYHDENRLSCHCAEHLFKLYDGVTHKFVFAHGDFILKNLLQAQSGKIIPIDWEFSGAYLSGFDLALLYATSVYDENFQKAIREEVIKLKIEKEFLFNSAIVLIREIGICRREELPELDRLEILKQKVFDEIKEIV